MDRRIFFRQMGYGTAGFMFLPNMISSCTLNGNGDHNHSIVIDGIMPIAAIIDCSQLLAASGSLSHEFRGLVIGDINLNLPGNLSRLGSSIPFEDDQMLDYLERFKNNWDPASEVDRKKGSMLLGWLMFHPLKTTMSEVYNKLISQGYHYDNITAFYDTYMLKQVSGEFEAGNLPETSAREFFNALVPRMITRLHTFKPDYLDGPGWVIRMSDWRINNKEKMKQYASLMINHEQEMEKYFIKKYNVYNSEDRLIQLVRKQKSSLSPESVDKLILSDPGNSMYSTSLVRGYKNVIAAEQFLLGRSTLNELRQLLSNY